MLEPNVNVSGGKCRNALQGRLAHRHHRGALRGGAADLAHLRPEDLEERVRGAFRQGLKKSHVDWHHLPRQA